MPGGCGLRLPGCGQRRCGQRGCGQRGCGQRPTGSGQRGVVRD